MDHQTWNLGGEFEQTNLQKFKCSGLPGEGGGGGLWKPQIDRCFMFILSSYRVGEVEMGTVFFEQWYFNKMLDKG